MFKKVAITTIALIMTATLSSNAQTIKLPAPQTTGGMALSEAIATRHSTREFDPTRQLSEQQIADLLWSGAGVNRAESGMRTNPTAMNSQEIDLYLFTSEGVYLYDAKANAIEKKADGDHRMLIAGNEQFKQDFVMDAPVAVVMVADLSRFERKADRNASMATLDGGIVCENICLYCSAAGLATVPRVTMDTDGIKALLGLGEQHLVLINNPVGYAK